MTDDRLLEALRNAGEVPPPPDRDGAFDTAMAAIPGPRARWLRPVGLLAAAALLLVPPAVVALRSEGPGQTPAPGLVQPGNPTPATTDDEEEDRSGPNRGSDGEDRSGPNRGSDDDPDDSDDADDSSGSGSGSEDTDDSDDAPEADDDDPADEADEADDRDDGEHSGSGGGDDD